MLFIMNTKTTVPTETPEANQFGHVFTDTQYPASFVYLVNAETGGTPKVYATYGLGPDEVVGNVVPSTHDTGLGHRRMPRQKIVAVKTAAGVEGTLPKGKTIQFWVAK